MHPDAIIAALKNEIDRLDPHAADYDDRKKAIEAEIAATDALERPATEPDKPDTVTDTNHAYLDGLNRELERVDPADKKRVEDIHTEIKRVKALIHKEVQMVEEKVSEAEIEMRKAVRGSGKVSRASNPPAPTTPADTAVKE